MVDGIMRANGDSCDAYRCRWPECNCYSPQGPQSCVRQTAALTRVYADLLAGQEPLGDEFEGAWAENIEELYER